MTVTALLAPQQVNGTSLFFVFLYKQHTHSPLRLHTHTYTLRTYTH
jgi:hypothetical protein